MTRGVVVCAAGSLPGDLHKLWRPRHPTGYHVEYGYSCMGYEVAGGIGVRLAEPDREVFVMVGDGSWLLMSSELVTAAEQGVRITCVLIDNYGYGSIGGLSRSLGSHGFGTDRTVGVDLEANARSLGRRGACACGRSASCAPRSRRPRRARPRRSSCSSATRSSACRATSRGGTCPSPRSRSSCTVDQARRTYERERARERPFF